MTHYTQAVFQAGVPILWAYFAWMRKFAKHPEKYPEELRYKKLRKLLIRLSNSFNIKYHVDGLENIPEETCCFISNHLSAYDPLALICVLDKPCTFVSKKELEDKPFAGKVIKGMEGLFLDRDDLKQSLRIMMKVEDDLKNVKNKNWIIYPEGTRNKDVMKPLMEFHHGTFRPAYKAKVPIVPVVVYGTFRALKRRPNFKKYPIYIKILKPLYPGDYESMSTQEIAKLTQERIQRVLDFEMRKLDHDEMKKIGNKNYRFNQIL